jgi:hypothetical protein
VWYNLAIHFVTRGLEFHQQLKLNSFEFHFDENNREYACLSHEMKQTNGQGGLDSRETCSDKRMYAQNDSHCPVAALKLLISKTDPASTSLFNHCCKDALSFKHRILNIFGAQINPSKLTNSVDLLQISPRISHVV